ncbi:MAG: hypothetical protein NT092_11740 [Bacteroidia bacterium]|nr:hypothetical protein [Bacteroidia bacterium]
MSETTNSKNVRDDEIDLLDLFKRMGKSLDTMFKTLGRWFLVSIVFLFRNWLPLLLSIVLGVGASYLIKYTSASFYTSDLVLRTNTLPAADMISYINRLHTYCLEDNQSALQEAITLKPDQANNIIDINANWIIDKGRDGVPDLVDFRDSHNIYDTINIRMQDRLNIRVQIKVPQELNIVREGLIKFIDSDSLFSQHNRIRIRQNQELQSRISYDLLQLDSLQKIKYFEETQRMSQPGNGQMIFLQEQKTQLVYPEIQGLFERKQLLDADITLYKGIATVLSDFSIPTKRENGGMYYGKVLIPLFFVLTLIILIILRNRRKLKEVYNKY